MDIDYDTSKPLSPLGVYVCAIQCAYDFAQLGWNEALTGGMTIWVHGFNVEIDVEAAGDVHRLNHGHILLGLYATMVDIAAQSHFCQVSTTLLRFGRRIGIVSVETAIQRTLGSNVTNVANSSQLTAASPSIAATDPSGSIIDRDDRSFSVSYTYSDSPINSKDVFLAIIDGLVTAGQSSPGTPFQSLNAMSPSGNCAVNIIEVAQVDYRHVTKALKLVRDIMIMRKKFGEMTFALKVAGRTIASGSVKPAGHRSDA